MSVKLLTGHHMEFLSLRGGCTGSSESSQSTLVKILYFVCVAGLPLVDSLMGTMSSLKEIICTFKTYR